MLRTRWLRLRGIAQRLPCPPWATGRSEIVDGYPRQVWVNAAGDELIESYTIPSMAHGTPLATGAADNQCGVAGPFLLEVGISSSYHITKFFGLAAKRMAPESLRRPLGAACRKCWVRQMAQKVRGAARGRSAGAELPAKLEAPAPRYRRQSNAALCPPWCAGKCSRPDGCGRGEGGQVIAEFFSLLPSRNKRASASGTRSAL